LNHSVLFSRWNIGPPEQIFIVFEVQMPETMFVGTLVMSQSVLSICFGLTQESDHSPRALRPPSLVFLRVSDLWHSPDCCHE
jgi:hypothetical protein